MAPRQPTACIHFLGATGENTEAAKDCGCKSATGMTALAECERHGLVTFIGRAKDESIRCCLLADGDQGCGDYEPEPSPSAG